MERALRCLQAQPAAATSDYLRAVYGPSAAPDARSWRWEEVDVIWTVLLDSATHDCLMAHRTPDPAEAEPAYWAMHATTGLYAPPIGSKMEYPVAWLWHDELSCAGVAAEYGGRRAAPVVRESSWVEVFHYVRRGAGLHEEETARAWLYRARGSGVWLNTGKTIEFDDTIDLAMYLVTRGRRHGGPPAAVNGSAAAAARARRLLNDKSRLLELAGREFDGVYDTVAFARHVDRGYNRAPVCTEPTIGWNAVYFTMSELVILRGEPASARRTRTEPHRYLLPLLRAGVPPLLQPCHADAGMLATRWPSLPKDAKWQLGVLRCSHGEVASAPGIRGDGAATRPRKRARAAPNRAPRRFSATPRKTESAATRLWQDFHNSGVLISLAECSWEAPAGSASALALEKSHYSLSWKKDRAGPYLRALREQNSLFECLLWRIGGMHAPASVLRWDLPAAVYSGGRWWVGNSTYPYSLAVGFAVRIPAESRASGAGRESGSLSRGVAFGHDAIAADRVGVASKGDCKEVRSAASHRHAMTADYSKVHVWTRYHLKLVQKQWKAVERWARERRGGAGSASPAEQNLSFGPDDYARTRYEIGLRGPRESKMYNYKWWHWRFLFANAMKPSSCYHRDWEDAFTDQKAWVSYLASRGELDRGEPTPPALHDTCMLYNQVHVSYGLDDLLAIVYVNDTTSAGSAAAAEVAYHKAARFQQYLANRSSRPTPWRLRLTVERRLKDDTRANFYAIRRRVLHVPIVQLRFSPECYDPRLAERRAAGAARLFPRLGENTLFIDA